MKFVGFFCPLQRHIKFVRIIVLLNELRSFWVWITFHILCLKWVSVLKCKYFVWLILIQYSQCSVSMYWIRTGFFHCRYCLIISLLYCKQYIDIVSTLEVIDSVWEDVCRLCAGSTVFDGRSLSICRFWCLLGIGGFWNPFLPANERWPYYFWHWPICEQGIMNSLSLFISVKMFIVFEQQINVRILESVLELKLNSHVYV